MNSRLEIQEESLTRVSMEIHDNICQNLGAIKHRLSAIIQSPEPSQDSLKEISTGLSENISQLRNVSHTLNKDHIHIVGLLTAIEEEIKFQSSIHPVTFHLDVQGENDYLPGNTELLLFRVMQEATSNSIKHGGAKEIHITINYAEEKFEMNIKDNGSGFDIDHLDATKGIGLLNMRQRIQLVKGTFNISSTMEHGTEIKISITHKKEIA